MKRRWHQIRRALRANRLFFCALAVAAALLAAAAWNFDLIGGWIETCYRGHGVQIANMLMEEWVVEETERTPVVRKIWRSVPLVAYLEEQGREDGAGRDPAWEIGSMGERREGGDAGESGDSWESGDKAGGEWGNFSEGGVGVDGERRVSGYSGESGDSAGSGPLAEYAENEGEEGESGDTGGIGGAAFGGTDAGSSGENEEEAGEVIAMKPAGQTIIREKLADYDYVMQNFYSVHPTTTAGRELMDAKEFLGMDFSIEKKEGEPQILIYHTHSQEEFADYPENPEATIVSVGTYLTRLLEERGYNVIHDESVYDFRDGKLDRSQAYTYALDGITGILQEYPSIEVILDIHRDGVAESTRLVKEINGKMTAQIMFFNGLSQTPDGEIAYLPNPNRAGNLGFSFQLQLAAAEKYPGFTRKIYLKGLRYNEHLRARSALIEVGAQTNTLEEAKNAMEPLAELLAAVLKGKE